MTNIKIPERPKLDNFVIMRRNLEQYDYKQYSKSLEKYSDDIEQIIYDLSSSIITLIEKFENKVNGK
jgi:hypothetical protein